MALGAIIGGVGSIVSSVIAGKSAREEQRRALREKKRLEKKMAQLEADRQDVINPYAGIQDLSSMITNPFANLSVATGAAEMKIEEADISLANTLDTMRATGASAGGATALAQAALRSKKDVTNSIELQEKSNEDKRARGEEKQQAALTAEQQRLQNADVKGRGFVYSETEKREMGQLDRTAGLIEMATGVEAQAKADALSAKLGVVGGITDTVGGVAGMIG
jgi:hypothetical protein|tara:strand:- start:838 stop:1503 length:666 start_codon:yes stop_codon:yes gene_type:complete